MNVITAEHGDSLVTKKKFNHTLLNPKNCYVARVISSLNFFIKKFKLCIYNYKYIDYTFNG